MHSKLTSAIHIYATNESGCPNPPTNGPSAVGLHTKCRFGQTSSGTSGKFSLSIQNRSIGNSENDLDFSYIDFLFFKCVHFQWMLSENVQNFDDVKFDAASLIAKLYQEQNQSKMAQQVLRKALQISQHNVYWHCRLLFQLAVRIADILKCV